MATSSTMTSSWGPHPEPEPPTGSPPLALAATDWRKIGKGLLIALAGSGLAYVGQSLPVLDHIGYGWLAPLAAVHSILAAASA